MAEHQVRRLPVVDGGKVVGMVAQADVARDLDDGTTGHVLPGDLEATPPSEPVAALLPGLDPTTMGWKARAWYLGEHGPRLFDRNGNAGPTIWWDGRIVGGWASMPDGVIQMRSVAGSGMRKPPGTRMRAL